jgi:Domain of unknown function (DUF5666)
MIGAATSPASAARRRWVPALAGLGIVALAVTACGSNGTTAATATPAATVGSPAAPSASPTPTGARAAFPGVVGTAAAVSGSTMEVQNPTSGQVTVTFTATTPITDTVTVTSKDVTVGSCVTVVGTPPAAGSASAGGAAARSVTATSVTISAPVKGSCTGAGGFGGFGGGGFGGGGFGGGPGSASPRPSFSPRPRPSGSRGAFGNGAFGGANGKVTSVSASGFVVQSRTRAASTTTTSVTVTISATTKYLKTVAAKPSALKVGQCITAIGTPNSIGAVAARTIRISQPGPSGCVTGFGGRGGFGRPTTNA